MKSYGSPTIVTQCRILKTSITPNYLLSAMTLMITRCSRTKTNLLSITTQHQTTIRGPPMTERLRHMVAEILYRNNPIARRISYYKCVTVDQIDATRYLITLNGSLIPELDTKELMKCYLDSDGVHYSSTKLSLCDNLLTESLTTLNEVRT
jgi:hypothetical protein